MYFKGQLYYIFTGAIIGSGLRTPSPIMAPDVHKNRELENHNGKCPGQRNIAKRFNEQNNGRGRAL